MAKNRAQKRKSEVKDKPEENHEEQEEKATNGESSSGTSSKKRKTSVRNGTANDALVSSSKKKSDAKAEEKEDSTDYEVLKIVDVRYVSGNKREFLIRWKNYSPKRNSWEPEENLSCDELIAEFLEQQDKLSKEPKKQLRKKPSATQLFASPGNNRRSKRSGGSRKNYNEAEDGDED